MEVMIEGQSVNRHIEGIYNVEGMELKIETFQEGGNSNPTIRAYVDDNIVAETGDVLSEWESSVDKTAAAISGEDSHSAEGEKNDPRPLAFKMLNDLETSVGNNELSRSVFDQFSKLGKDVEWAGEV